MILNLTFNWEGLGNLAGIWGFPLSVVGYNLRFTRGYLQTVIRNDTQKPTEKSVSTPSSGNLCRRQRIDLIPGSQSLEHDHKGNAKHSSILGAIIIHNRESFSFGEVFFVAMVWEFQNNEKKLKSKSEINVEIQLTSGGDYQQITTIPQKDAQEGPRNLGAMLSPEGNPRR